MFSLGVTQPRECKQCDMSVGYMFMYTQLLIYIIIHANVLVCKRLDIKYKEWSFTTIFSRRYVYFVSDICI